MWKAPARGWLARRHYKQLLATVPPSLSIIRVHGHQRSKEILHANGSLGCPEAGPWLGQITVDTGIRQDYIDNSHMYVADLHFKAMCNGL